MRPARVLGVFAHPDDETLAAGPLLAHLAGRGATVDLLIATRGERGWRGSPSADPGPEAVGRLREAEARAAARVLGVDRVAFLGLRDGEVQAAPPGPTAANIAAVIRRSRPDVIVGFGPDGLTAHPDHVATAHLASAATILAAGPGPGGPPHVVPKAYRLVETRERIATLERALGRASGFRGRRVVAWEPWAVTVRLDTRRHVDVARRAALCHASQLEASVGPDPDDEVWRALFGEQLLQRAHVLVGAAAQEHEDDPLAGIALAATTGGAVPAIGPRS